MTLSITDLEARLDSFDRATRDEALATLVARAAASEVTLPPPQPKVNLHVHSFYSYNPLGYSPTHIVWRARREGLMAVGLVDFDVLDGVDEFHAAGEALGIPTVAGMETRAFIPELAESEINSPGEPGVAYHMVTGLLRSTAGDPEAEAFAEMLRTNAQRRNEAVVDRVNDYLAPVTLDYAADVLPLSPSGTPTERHLCAAYEAKAKAVLPDPGARARFWADRLGQSEAEVGALLDDSRTLQALIRKKTMKRGGVGYQAPTSETFPLMTDFNRFGLALGGIPALAWLDGTRPGEQPPEALLDLHEAAGTRAVNIIPDRNWNLAHPEERAEKVANLVAMVAATEARALPLSVGTEMNAPGLKFVDDFAAPELTPVVDAFLRGAAVLVGHTAAGLAGEPGYLSDVALDRWPDRADRNAHFTARGADWRRVPPPPSARRTTRSS